MPLGLSIFSNAIDTIKALDITFDSCNREFVLGRKRIIVHEGTVQAVYNPQTNQAEKYFGSDDEVYQA